MPVCCEFVFIGLLFFSTGAAIKPETACVMQFQVYVINTGGFGFMGLLFFEVWCLVSRRRAVRTVECFDGWQRL